MTGIVGITALQELRAFKGFEKAIIAGGFVRDSLIGGKVKDLDIFIPCKSHDDFVKIVEQHFHREVINTPVDTIILRAGELEDWAANNPGNTTDYQINYLPATDSFQVIHQKEFHEKVIPDIGNFKGFVRNVEKKHSYKNSSKSYVTHYDCKYMDFLDVDVIGYVHEPVVDFNGREDEFGEKLVSEFSYNIDKVYFNGETIQTKEFLSDFRNETATLVQLQSIDMLPHAMKKFERLREKYPNYRFRSTILELKQKEKEEDTKNHNLAKRHLNYFSSSSTAAGGVWDQF